MNETNGLPELPQGWVRTTIGEIAATSSGGTPSRGRTDYYGGSIPWVKSGELNDGIVFQTEEFITELGLCSSSAKIFPAGTLCIALYGATVGKLGMLGIDAATNQAVCGIFVPPLLETQYLFHFLFWQRRNLIELGKGGAQPNLSQDIVRRTVLPLPPLPEQQRIVAKIEELFTKLDAGVAALKQARAQLGRYRQAVLKAAVTGELTEQWRAAHSGELEPAADLLARILRERRAKWEADQLAKLHAAGKPPKNDDWKRKYQAPAAPDTSELPELPEGWMWARAEQLCDFITKGTTPAAHNLFSESGEIPFIKVYNLTHVGLLDFTVKPTFVSQATHSGELARSKVFPGDVLMNIVGPPLGKVSIVPDTHEEWNINQAVAVFRPMPSFDRKYLSICLLTGEIQSWAERRAKATAGQFNLTLEICRDLPLPLPSLLEQQQMVSEVERLLSIADAMEQTIAQSLKQAERMRQAILQQAFAGQLVPQDADDEPAAQLLARIRAARARTAETAPKQQRASRPRKPHAV